MENNEHLSHIRHTLAHLLAQASIEQYPHALLTLGPSVDNGFYYDIDFGADKISDENLAKLEKSMKKNISVLPIILNMIDEDGIHILLEAKINGKKANLLIDTGASKSVFDIKRVKRFVDHTDFDESEKMSTGLGTNTMESKTTNFSLFIRHNFPKFCSKKRLYSNPSRHTQ